MALTLTNFRKRVGHDIGLLGEGIPFSAADDQLMGELYTDVYWELDVENLLDWGETDDIPNEYVGCMVDLVGARAAPKFRLPPKDGTPWDNAYQQAMARLRRLAAVRYTPTTTPSTYY